MVKSALYVLSLSWPKPSPKVVEFLGRQLPLPENSAEKTGWIAGFLLWATHDASNVHPVLAAAKARQDRGLTVAVLHSIGQWEWTRTNEEALEFVRDGLTHEDELVRFAAVETVDRMERAQRGRFFKQLKSITENPDEKAATNALAQKLLAPQ